MGRRIVDRLAGSLQALERLEGVKSAGNVLPEVASLG